MTEPSLTYLRPEVSELKRKLDAFIEEEVIPAEEESVQHISRLDGAARWTPEALPPRLKQLQQRSQELGLWNLFLPPRLWKHVPAGAKAYVPTTPLSYREYGILAESMGRSELGAMACNCSAPDTGNMEVLLEFGTPQQQEQYLIPLLKGEIRSTFLMTEPDVASSDPTNLSTTLVKQQTMGSTTSSYLLTGRKWWSTGAMDPRCRFAIVVAKMETAGTNSNDATGSTTKNENKHGKHTIVMVPLPHPSVKMIRPLTVFGYDDAPFGHAEVALEGIPLTSEHLIGGEGSGFKVSQARLGPGRIHHCMRAIGIAQRCFELMLQRTLERQTFGKYLWQHGSVQRDIADSFADLNAARMLTLQCAHEMDLHGPRASRQYISSIKVAVPQLMAQVIDRAVQVHGGAGVSEDYVLAKALANMRTLRIADGPDEVHRQSVALLELKRLYRKQFAQDPPTSKL
jgi:acyl-CoA dehydrogenase